MYAAINSDGYNVVLLFHLLTVIIGTGSAFLVQFINAKDSDILETASVQRIVGFLIAPSLFLGSVFGGALVGLSDDVYDFSQLWLTIAGVLWITACGSATLLSGLRSLPFPTNHVSSDHSLPCCIYRLSSWSLLWFGSLVYN